MNPQSDLFEEPAKDAMRPGGDDPTILALADFARRAYLDYAVSVVKGRALPDVCDGLKPVQRRILFAMDSLGLGPGAKPVKSARVVGDVIGKYHPHGDQAAYDALVRMAQDFTLRYPLIDGQGNFGSRDDDPAAAMRYTEARLTPIARLLLDELGQGTVDFAPNYDGSHEEPRLLPARLPIVLMNGASGIAVGMATEIPPHNLREVVAAAQALLRDPGAGLPEVLAHVHGPDWPGGGQLISPAADVRAVYETGRGSLKVRARFRFEELARGQWQVVVTELPPGASARRVQEEIEEITNPKVKAGRKSLSTEQQNLRQSVMAVLDRMRDESNREAPVRLVFEPRSSRIDRQELVNTLLAHTSLEGTASVNLVMIGGDGRPRQKGILAILREWIDFRISTVRRRTAHRLERVLDRIHVLEGRQMVLLQIERVIALIRGSDDPGPDLQEAFGLTPRQAEDILEMRLRQLARLEGIRLEKELGELRTEEGGLRRLLGTDAALRRQVGKELDDDAKKHGDARRTLVEEAERVAAQPRVVDEPVTVIVSAQGFVRSRGGHGHDASQLSFRAGDELHGAFECRSIDTLVALGSNGRCYSIAVSSLPSARGDGLPVTSMIELEAGTRLLAYLAGPAQMPLLLSTAAGYGFACQLGDLFSRHKAGKQFLTVDADGEPLRPAIVDPAVDHSIACLASSGKLLVFPATEIKSQPSGGRGVQLLGLAGADRMLCAVSFGAPGLLVHGTSPRSGGPVTRELRGALLDPHRGSRARRGGQVQPRINALRLERAPSA